MGPESITGIQPSGKNSGSNASLLNCQSRIGRSWPSTLSRQRRGVHRAGRALCRTPDETAAVREALRAFAELGTALLGARDAGEALDAVIADGPPRAPEGGHR